jgi:histidine triad (HIT) family protein
MSDTTGPTPAPITRPVHTVTITGDDGHPHIEFTCHGGPDAPCHLYPDCDCVYWQHGEGHTHEHASTPHDECWMASWFDNADHGAVDPMPDMLGEPGTDIHVGDSGPITTEYMYDFILWRFAGARDGNPAVVTPPRIHRAPWPGGGMVIHASLIAGTHTPAHVADARDCVFCARVRNRQYAQVYSDTVARFEPLNPVTPGHMLFLPTWHAEHPHKEAVRVAMSCAEYYGGRRGVDYNLITSSGPSATQTIPHIHVHYIPRRPGDGLLLPWSNPVSTHINTSVNPPRTSPDVCDNGIGGDRE